MNDDQQETEIPVPISNQKRAVLEAHRKGYRIKNGVILNPQGREVKGWIRRRRGVPLPYIWFTVKVDGRVEKIAAQRW